MLCYLCEADGNTLTHLYSENFIKLKYTCLAGESGDVLRSISEGTIPHVTESPNVKLVIILSCICAC